MFTVYELAAVRNVAVRADPHLAPAPTHPSRTASRIDRWRPFRREWILRETRRGLEERGVPPPATHFEQKFSAADTGLFLWEAFVTGEAKAGGTDADKGGHVADALTTCKAFASRLPDPGNARPCEPPHAVRSLIGAAVLWSDWSQDLDVHRAGCLVVKPAGPAV